MQSVDLDCLVLGVIWSHKFSDSQDWVLLHVCYSVRVFLLDVASSSSHPCNQVQHNQLLVLDVGFCVESGVMWKDEWRPNATITSDQHKQHNDIDLVFGFNQYQCILWGQCKLMVVLWIQKSTVRINIDTRAWHDQPIDHIGPIQPPIRPSKGQNGVLHVIDCSVAGSMTSQPPGSCPSVLRVMAHSQLVASFGEGVLPLCSGAVGTFYSPTRQAYVCIYNFIYV